MRDQAQAKAREIIPALFLDMFGDPRNGLQRWKTVMLGDLVDGSRGISYGIVQRGDDVEVGIPVIRISKRPS